MNGGCSAKMLLLVIGLMICVVPVCTAAGPAPTSSSSQVDSRSIEVASAHNGPRAHLGDLPAEAQTAISAAIGHHDPIYQFTKIGERYRGANTAHNLAMEFRAGGVEVRVGGARWGLKLSAIGYGDRLCTLSATDPAVNANRVEYRYGEIAEWYVNGPLGLEQGFTIAQAPAGHKTGALTLALALSGDLVPTLDETRTGLVLAKSDGGEALRYGGLYAYDAAGRHLPAWMEVNEARVLVRVDDTVAQYPIVVDPWIQQAKLTAPNGAQGEIFGYSVAVSGDGNTALIGAIGGNSGKGAAYLFKRAGSTWSYYAPLLGPDSASLDQFGSSVALNTDGTIALIGAYHRDSNRGAAYVFARQNQTWSHQATLTAPGAAADDYFGVSVALNSVGSTALIGANGKSTFRGAAYVFTRSGSTWPHQATLTDASGAQSDSFGTAVTLNSDGNTALVGAPNSLSNQGKTVVFTWSGSTWTQQAALLASDGVQAFGWFGVSVALTTDGNTGLIASNFNNAYPMQTAAYVFTRSGSTWTQAAELNLVSTDDVPRFGSVALSADGGTALLGAWEGNTNKGIAFLFTGSGSAWTPRARLTAADGADGDRFGDRVALSADGTTALIGAALALNYDGAAYVISNVVQSHNVGAFRPSDGNWYIRDLQTGTVTVQQWGAPTDKRVVGRW